MEYGRNNASGRLQGREIPEKSLKFPQKNCLLKIKSVTLSEICMNLRAVCQPPLQRLPR